MIACVCNVLIRECDNRERWTDKLALFITCAFLDVNRRNARSPSPFNVYTCTHVTSRKISRKKITKLESTARNIDV